MSHHQETFEGCTIEIKDDIDLTINGKVIDYEQDTAKKFSSKYLPTPNMIHCWRWQERSPDTPSSFPRRKNSQH